MPSPPSPEKPDDKPVPLDYRGVGPAYADPR